VQKTDCGDLDFQIEQFGFRFGLKHNRKRKQQRLTVVMSRELPPASKTGMPEHMPGPDEG
jgi:hypothetical protein